MATAIVPINKAALAGYAHEQTKSAKANLERVKKEKEEAEREYENARYGRMYHHSQWLAMKSRANTKPLLASKLASKYAADKER